MSTRKERVKSIFDSDDSEDEDNVGRDLCHSYFKDEDDDETNNLRKTIEEVCSSLSNEAAKKKVMSDDNSKSSSSSQPIQEETDSDLSQGLKGSSLPVIKEDALKVLSDFDVSKVGLSDEVEMIENKEAIEADESQLIESSLKTKNESSNITASSFTETHFSSLQDIVAESERCLASLLSQEESEKSVFDSLLPKDDLTPKKEEMSQQEREIPLKEIVCPTPDKSYINIPICEVDFSEDLSVVNKVTSNKKETAVEKHETDTELPIDKMTDDIFIAQDTAYLIETRMALSDADKSKPAEPEKHTPLASNMEEDEVQTTFEQNFKGDVQFSKESGDENMMDVLSEVSPNIQDDKELICDDALPDEKESDSPMTELVSKINEIEKITETPKPQVAMEEVTESDRTLNIACHSPILETPHRHSLFEGEESELQIDAAEKRKKVRVEDVFTDSDDEVTCNEYYIKSSSLFPSVTTVNKGGEGDGAAKKVRKRRMRATSINLPAIMLAFEKGWIREVVYRATGACEAGMKKVDIYYFTPDGKRLRSRIEVEDYLTKNKISDLTLQNFSFFKEPLGIEDRYEKIKQAHYKHDVDAISATGISPVEAPKKRGRKPKDVSIEDSGVKKRGRKTKDGTPQKRMKSDMGSDYGLISMEGVMNGVGSLVNTAIKADSAVYATHLFPCNPPLTQPRIITPLIKGAMKDRNFHCTPSCFSGGGNVPNLQCIKCICLFHPECCDMPPATVPLILASIAKFLCPNCYQEERENLGKGAFISVPCYEPLAYDPSSESEDEGLCTDFEHPSYKRMTLRPSTPQTPTSDLKQLGTLRNSAFSLHNYMATPPLTTSSTMYQSQNVSLRSGMHTAPQYLYLPQASQMGIASSLFVSPPNTTSANPTSLSTTFLSSNQSSPHQKYPQQPSSAKSARAVDAHKKQLLSAEADAFIRGGEHFLEDMTKAYQVLRHIFSFLSVTDLLVVSRVCHLWKDLALGSFFWSVVRLRNVCVKDWDKLVEFLERRGTVELDLRKMVIHFDEEWDQLLEEKSENLIANMEILEIVREETEVKKKSREEGTAFEESSAENAAEIAPEGVADVSNETAEKKERRESLMSTVLNEHDYFGQKRPDDESSDSGSSDSETESMETPEKVAIRETEKQPVDSNSHLEAIRSNLLNQFEKSAKQPQRKSPRALHKSPDSSHDVGKGQSGSPLISSEEKMNPLHRKWTAIAKSLSSLRCLRSLVIGSCESAVVQIVLKHCGQLTSISALNLNSGCDEDRIVIFDPSVFMHTKNLQELRLGSKKNFIFQSNFNFIKLPSIRKLMLKGLKTAETGWPYLGTQLTHLHLTCISTFSLKNWDNLSSMIELVELELDGSGSDLDSEICSALVKLTKLSRLALLDWNIGPKLPFTLKKLHNIKYLHVIPAVESLSLRGIYAGRLMVILDSTKHLEEFIWGIQPASRYMDETSGEKIYIQNMKPGKETGVMEGEKVRPIAIDSLKGFIKCRIPQTKVTVRKVAAANWITREGWH